MNIHHLGQRPINNNKPTFVLRSLGVGESRHLPLPPSLNAGLCLIFISGQQVYNLCFDHRKDSF
jgi:hypothetical protein